MYYYRGGWGCWRNLGTCGGGGHGKSLCLRTVLLWTYKCSKKKNKIIFFKCIEQNFRNNLIQWIVWLNFFFFFFLVSSIYVNLFIYWGPSAIGQTLSSVLLQIFKLTIPLWSRCYFPHLMSKELKFREI